MGRLRPLWENVPDGWRLWFVATGEAVRGEAGSAVRELTRISRNVRVVSMFEAERNWEDSLAVATRGMVAVLRRLAVRVVITYGPTAGGLAASFASQLLAIPHLHILRGDEDHPFRATKVIPKLASKVVQGPDFIAVPQQTPPNRTALCLVDPYNTTKYRRLYANLHSALAGLNSPIVFVCPHFDKLALRKIRRMQNLTHRKCVPYPELLSLLTCASIFVTNTEVAYLEARVCGVPTILVDEWGQRRIEGGERFGVEARWENVREVWEAAEGLRMGIESRGLRRG